MGSGWHGDRADDGEEELRASRIPRETEREESRWRTGAETTGSWKNIKEGERRGGENIREERRRGSEACLLFISCVCIY